LGKRNRRCQYYTIVKNGDELSEASKFLTNKRNKQSPDFNRLQTRFNQIKDRNGARTYFFKSEGREADLVHALHARAKKQGYLQLNKLRWYCIRLSERCVIFGNGGVKEDAKTQDDPHLKEKEAAMRWVDRCIETATKRGDFAEDERGNIHGVMDFNMEVLEKYGLQ
jgi:uncharacterized Fe-S cluster-containing protein